MKIGFLISGIGIYGSVREIVENGNVFSDLGHDVTIYNPEGEKIIWLPFKGKVKLENELFKNKLDILILTTQPTNYYVDLFSRAKADLKIFCFMGLDPNFEVINENIKYLIDNYYITADGQWQIDWIKKNTDAKKIINAQIGGINRDMFYPAPKAKRNKLNIGWSGDLRKRKGGTTLKWYFEENNIATLTYFNKGIPQSQMANWFSKIDIFIDNHYSGGWCNPVAEAMACRVPVICSDTYCNQSFAIHKDTCLKFKFNDMVAMEGHLNYLINNENIRYNYSLNAYDTILKFDYKIISKQFLDACQQ